MTPNEYSSQTYFQSIVGLAFAEYKLSLKCDKTIRDKAREVLRKKIAKIKVDAGEIDKESFSKFQTCLDILDKMPTI